MDFNDDLGRILPDVGTTLSNADRSADHPVPSISQRCFSEETPDATIYFQIVDLGRQLFIWIGAGGAKMNNLFMAIQTHTV